MKVKARIFRTKRTFESALAVREMEREPGSEHGQGYKAATPSLERPDEISRLLRPVIRGKVLDVGIGGGPLAKRLQRPGVSDVIRSLLKGRPSLKRAEIHGIDLSSPLLKKARERGARPIKGAGEFLPFKENSFDSAMCLDAFEYFEKPVLVVREIHRVLKPGGTMVMNVDKSVLPERRMRNMLLKEGLEIGEVRKVAVPEIEDKPVFLFAFARKKK